MQYQSIASPLQWSGWYAGFLSISHTQYEKSAQRNGQVHIKEMKLVTQLC